jgi:hypothetical protein
MSLNWTTNIETQEFIYGDIENVIDGTSNIIQVPIRTKYIIFKVTNFVSNPVTLFNTSGFFFLTLLARNGSTRATGSYGATGYSFISQAYCRVSRSLGLSLSVVIASLTEITPANYTPSSSLWGLFTNDPSNWSIGASGASNEQLTFIRTSNPTNIIVSALVAQNSNQLYSLKLVKNGDSANPVKTVYVVTNGGSIGFNMCLCVSIQTEDYFSIWLQLLTSNTTDTLYYVEFSIILWPS